MSKGVFTLLDSLHGKQDSMLTATKQLYDRLNEIYLKKTQLNVIRKNNGQATIDPRATILDITATHLFYIKAEWKPYVAVGYEYFKVDKEGSSNTSLYDNSKGSNIIKFPLKSNCGPFLNDMVVHIVIDQVYTTLSANPGNDILKLKYCDLLGTRLFKCVSFKVDDIVIDEYTSDDIALYDEFFISDEKRLSYNRCIGQEEIFEGTYYHPDYNVTQVSSLRAGLQTPKYVHGPVDLWIPLFFWFNTDVKQCLINSMIGSEQKYIEITLEDANNIIATTNRDGNIISSALPKISLRKIELYTRNIYVNPEVHDLFIKRTNLSLIRVRKQHTKNISTTDGTILFDQLKYPIEQLMFGFKPTKNEKYPISMTNWHLFSEENIIEIPTPVIINNPPTTPINELVVRTITAKQCVSPVDSIGFILHGNTLYPQISSRFYNQYLPFSFSTMVSPRDCGKFLITFNLHNKFNPSGHLNDSQIREFYINYQMSTASVSNNIKFVASARCINFIYYNNGTARIRYAT